MVALFTIDAQVEGKFLKKNIFSRYSTPRVIISEGGKHLCNSLSDSILAKYGVKHRVATLYHLQISGQVEISNREFKKVIELMVNASRKHCSQKLDDALWAYSTAFKTPMDISPYQVVFGKACNLLVEFEHRAYWMIKALTLM